jgi:hypothetical protein
MRIWTAANIAFAVGSLLMISLGRWNVGYAWRYMTPAILLWIFVFVGFGYEMSRLKLEGVFSGLMLIFCVGIATRQVFQNAIRWDVAGIDVARARIAAAAYAVGVEDSDIAVAVNASGSFSRHAMDQIRDRRLMFWQFSPYDKFGTVFPRPSRNCAGGIEGVHLMYSSLYPAFEIAGFSRQSTHQILLLNQQNRVVGLGAMRDTGPREKWYGFLPASAAGATVTPVALDDSAGPCVITAPFLVEGNPRKFPVFTDQDRSRWEPIGLSETGELNLPHTLSIDASKTSGGYNSVIVHLKLEQENFGYFNIPGYRTFMTDIPAGRWVYVVYHVKRPGEVRPDSPPFESGVFLLGHWPPMPVRGWLDGAWISRDMPPATDREAVVYFDGSREPTAK